MEEFKLLEKTLKIKHNDKEVIFVLRQLNTDEYYSTQDQCIDKKSEDFSLDTNKLNILRLSKSIIQPSMNTEQVAKLPAPISQRLIAEFNILNGVEQTFFLDSQTKSSSQKKK